MVIFFITPEETIMSGITAVFQFYSPVNVHLPALYTCYFSRYFGTVKLGITVDNQYFTFPISIF